MKQVDDEDRTSKVVSAATTGACPGEILHLVLLGWFKYLIDVFQSSWKIKKLLCNERCQC